MEENLRKSLKVEGTENIDFDELHKKSIDNRIDKYELERYEHILREKMLIIDILEICKDIDEETKLKYTDILEKLEIEQKNYMQKYIEKSRSKKDESKEDIDK